MRGQDALPTLHVLPLVEARLAPREHTVRRDRLVEALEGASVDVARPAGRLVEEVDERLKLPVDGRRTLPE